MSAPRDVGGHPPLRPRRLGIDTHTEPVIYMRADCHVCRAEGFTARERVEVRAGTRSVIATLNVVTSDLLAPGEAAVSEAAWALLGAREGDAVRAVHPAPVESLRHVRAKLFGNRLDSAAMRAIINDVVARRYADIELAAFVAAGAGDRLDVDETVALTHAMIEVGQRLTWTRDPVCDKHCVGGLPGNRTTPIVVAIAAASGLTIADRCLRSRNFVNVIVAGKQPSPQWLDMDAAIKHCTAGIGIWEWASNDTGGDPDVVLACAGDLPTIEILAAAALLREHLPALKVRVVNVVDLMTLQPREEHPHGLPDRDFDVLFTTDKPIIFAYHGYPWLIHRLTYHRTNHGNLHVRGYKEEGTTTTPFDMAVRNDLDRFHLVADVIDRVPKLGYIAAYAKQKVRDKLIEHGEYIVEYGEDMPEVRDWTWPFAHHRPDADARDGD
ncbi:MAG TPA: hypothetical protein VLD36_11985 [Burkholderiales bacterium]|nr:hypothetical protein [Burkholderiales bacterium]